MKMEARKTFFGDHTCHGHKFCFSLGLSVFDLLFQLLLLRVAHLVNHVVVVLSELLIEDHFLPGRVEPVAASGRHAFIILPGFFFGLESEVR